MYWQIYKNVEVEVPELAEWATLKSKAPTSLTFSVKKSVLWVPKHTLDALWIRFKTQVSIKFHNCKNSVTEQLNSKLQELKYNIIKWSIKNFNLIKVRKA